MKLPFTHSVLAVTASFVCLAATAHAANPGGVIPDRFIVELRPGSGPAAVAARHGLAPDFVYGAAVNGFAGFVPPGILRQLQADPEVANVIPDREVFAIGKPGGGGTTISRQSPQILPLGVERIGANQLFFDPVDKTGIDPSAIGVAVVDTGVDTAHPDLTVSSKYFTAFARTTGKDDHGHGTHVGGIIAAKNDGFDVVGVAPGATLYAVKVLNKLGSGSDSTVIAGLNWIAQNSEKVSPRIRVVNMSLGRAGSLSDNSAYRSAVQNLINLNIMVVVAAGNECSAEVSGMVPACYPEVMAVGSTTAAHGASAYPGFSGIPADTASYFTTDGAGVAISAPGEEKEDVAYTGAISSVGILSTKLGGGTTRMSGTSMASPHVAGVAALIYANYAASIPKDIREKITTIATLGLPYGSPTSCYTFDGILEGVLDAGAAQ